jgi:enterochelin esterase family protein
MSSGGICAWTVAWERPDQFRKVVSHVGSFTNIRGGHKYPELIRSTEWKPIRVFLQDGHNDNRSRRAERNWVIANHNMAAALEEMDYDYKYVYGEGGHNGNHGGAIFPDTMRWLWRDYPQ